MAIQSIQFQPTETGIFHEVIFAGDNIRLAGQIDYPNQPIPAGGYPLLFILQNACCTSRHGFDHHKQIGNQAGFAVFRWDKRGTGRSASGGLGNAEQDAIKAYQTAIQQADINPNRVVIWTQTDASLLLSENYENFKAIQNPIGIILSGNMLDENEILKLDTRIFCLTGERDWNLASRYAIKTAITHEEHYQLGSNSYIAKFADRKLIDTRNNMFHTGAEAIIKDWLTDLCPVSTLI
jgi:uncharacterized protein